MILSSALLKPAVAENETTDDGSALSLARVGDLEAFDEVYRTHAPRLLRHAMTLCGNPALAEELAQDTLVEAWKCLRRYNDNCQFFTWLCAILLNRYRNHLRKQRLLRFFTVGDPTQYNCVSGPKKVEDDGSLPNEAAMLRERADLVRKCLATLPAKQQQVIYLRFYVDDSLEEIAAALSCSVGTVKSRLFHGLEKLRGMKALSGEFSHFKTERTQ